MSILSSFDRYACSTCSALSSSVRMCWYFKNSLFWAPVCSRSALPQRILDGGVGSPDFFFLLLDWLWGEIGVAGVLTLTHHSNDALMTSAAVVSWFSISRACARLYRVSNWNAGCPSCCGGHLSLVVVDANDGHEIDNLVQFIYILSKHNFDHKSLHKNDIFGCNHNRYQIIGRGFL